MIRWSGRTEPRGGAAITVERILADHLAGKAARRERSAWVKLEADATCDACGATMFSGQPALYWPEHDKLACRRCGEARGNRQMDPDLWLHMCMPPGFAG